MKLHGYFRSSAAYRVRIALNLKRLSTEHLPHHLRKGERCAPGLSPPSTRRDWCRRWRVMTGAVLTQSLAIIEWREDRPIPARRCCQRIRCCRAKVRAFALAIACDVHPVQNLKVLARLRQLGVAEEKVTEWAAWANREGLSACEALIKGEQVGDGLGNPVVDGVGGGGWSDMFALSARKSSPKS